MLTQNTLLVLALALVVLILWNQKEGIAPWKSKKTKRSKKSMKPGKWFNILTSFYGHNRADDNGIGAGGVDLYKFPYSRRINDKFGTRTIYPVAVSTKDVGYYKYAILEIKNGEKRMFAQVVDECASGDCADNISEAKKQGRKLIDIHAAAFKVIGENDGLQKMKARVISRTGHTRDSQMNSVLTSTGRRGWVKSNWV